MNIETIGRAHRVRVSKDSCGDSIIRGKRGHLYVDVNRIMVCFTDDPDTTTRKASNRPLTTRKKSAAQARLESGLVSMDLDGDFEFICEIREGAIETALFEVLSVRRFMVTKGVPTTPPWMRKTTVEGHLNPQTSFAECQLVCPILPVLG